MTEANVRGLERVLVVVADDAVRAAICEVVSDLSGRTISTAETAASAARQLAQHGADVAIVDADLGDAEALVSQLLARDPPVASVLVSTDGAPLDLARRLAIPFIRSPFDVDDLMRAVDVALARR